MSTARILELHYAQSHQRYTKNFAVYACSVNSRSPRTLNAFFWSSASLVFFRLSTFARGSACRNSQFKGKSTIPARVVLATPSFSVALDTGLSAFWAVLNLVFFGWFIYHFLTQHTCMHQRACQAIFNGLPSVIARAVFLLAL